MSLPVLTPEQRAESLKKAAEMRKARADLKARLKAGTVKVEEVLERADSDAVVGKMRVLHLIESLPGRGRQGAISLMGRLDISEAKRVKGLGRVQLARLRTELVA